MSTKKYSVLTILFYAAAFFSPAFLPATNQVFATMIAYLLGAAVLIILYLQQNEWLSFERKESNWLKVIAFGLGGIFVAIFLQNIVLQIEQLFGQEVASENTQNIIQIVLQQPLFAIAVMIGGPIMEEFVFRRAITGFLEKYLNVWLAISISSFLFALIHQDGHLLLYFALGFFFSLLYYNTGKIWTSILAHVGMNTLVVIVNIFLQSIELPK